MKDYDLLIAKLYALVYGEDYIWQFDDELHLTDSVDYHITKTHLNGEPHNYDSRTRVIMLLLGLDHQHILSSVVFKYRGHDDGFKYVLDNFELEDIAKLYKNQRSGFTLWSIGDLIKQLRNIGYKVVKE